MTDQPNGANGQERKRGALHLLKETRAPVIRRGQRFLLQRLLNRGVASIDDVRAVIDIPSGVNPKCLGAVPGALAKAGIIERAGYHNSDRPEAHARPVSVWRLVDREAAEQWLRDHPELERPPQEKGQRFLVGW